MASTMDLGYIAASYSVAEPALKTLLDAPTADLVREFLQKVEERARDNETIQAEKLRSDVELETAVRSGNARAKQLKGSVDKGLKEVEEIRRKLADEENARASLESELQNLKSSSTSSTSESQALQSRITSLEASNSDALALLETKTSAHDSLADELSIQQQKIVALRREVSDLEEKYQTAENGSMTAKFREQSLQQEVELLKKSNEWHEEELKRRGTEHTKFRREKGAQIAELQRTLEDATQANEALRTTEQNLRSRVEELNQKLEEAYEQIQVKAEEAVKTEQSFRAERDNALRLAELQKKSAETARARQKELEQSVDQIKEDAASEIGNLQADINTERTEKEASERRVAELESRVENLQNELSTAQHAAAAPSTPRRNVNGVGSHGTPGREASPGIFSSPGGSRLKGGLSVTQLYTQYSKAKADLESERRRNEELSTNMDEMIQELENRSPEIEEMHMERDRLTAEVGDLAQVIQQANNDRDTARKAARKWEGKADGLAKEGSLLQQQLRDLSSQLKVALVEIHLRDQGLESLNGAEKAQLEAVARGEIEEGALDGMSDTGRFISQKLTIFRNVNELQNQNEQLLKLTRRIGEEMEGEEAKRKRNQQEQDLKELEELRTRVSEYKDVIQTLTTRADSYVQERDMFRRMLAHRGQLPAGADLSAIFGQSVDANAISATTSKERNAEPALESQTSVDFNKLIKEMQQHHDAYREETTTTNTALKQQADRLSKEKSELQGEIASVGSQLTLARERYDMLQSNYNMLKTENGELQKRQQALSEVNARQDIRTQQAAEDLVEVRGLSDGLRNENANLKAERELWKKIEVRLTEDNQSLMNERSRLNKMISDLQSLHNERELADSENRRRLQTRTETLESELSAAKRKLDEEVDQSRKAALRREYEQDQNRTRIEDLLKGSSNTKEELIAAKTQRDQLQTRVDEMKIELRNADEKAQALQPRLTSRNAGANGTEETNENALTREQELAVEIADLNRNLQLKQSELQQAEEQIEQYKAIAQAAEEALQNSTETTEQYRETIDRELAEKDARIQDLEKRLEEISSELATTNTELSEIRSRSEENAAKLSEQKSMFDSELARVRDESDRLAETARLHQEDLKSQAEISQQAQQHYEDELIKHAEATTNLGKMRTEFNMLKTEVAGYKAEAESAKVALSQNKDSWAETKAQYEQEITDLKNRREDVLAQNRRVHQQLEEVSAQIAALKQSRASAAGSDNRPGSPEASSDNFQEIIRYLRQEKEIVDMQYELSIQESKRLKQRLDHTQSQLDQTREKLEQERLSQTDRDQSATNHNKLMQTINELNVFRESNTSLRNEARSAQEQLITKIKEVENLLSQLEPIQTRVREVEHELESKEDEIKLLQEDRDRWQKRTQDIMSKYDRVDPAELEGLKSQITNLLAEKESFEAERRPLQEQIDAIPERVRLAQEEKDHVWEERRQKIVDQSKAKVRELIGTIKEQKVQLESASIEQARLSQELSSTKEELEKAKAARDEVLAELAQKSQLNGDATEDGQIDESTRGGVSDDEKAGFEARISAAEVEASTAEGKAQSEAARAVTLQQEVQALQTRVQELEGQITSLQQKLEAAHAQVSALQNAPLPVQKEVPSEQLENLEAELVAAKQEVEQLRAKADLATSISNISSDGSKSVTEQVTEQVELIRAELETKHNDRVRQAEEVFQRRADTMRKQLSTKLAAGKQSVQEELKVAHEEAMETLRKEHKLEIELIRKETSVAVADTKPVSAAPAPASDNARTPGDWKPSQTEIKDLIANDPAVKNLVSRNVLQRVESQKESWTVQIKQEEEKAWAAKLEEANKIASSAKEKAVAAAEEMATKRVGVKMNMATNRANAAMAKVEMVEKAATDTPERPVGEVWAIAKNAKPAAVTRPPPAQAVAATTQPHVAPELPATPQVQQQPGQGTTSQMNQAPRQPTNMPQQQQQQQGTAGQTLNGNQPPVAVRNPFVPQGNNPQQQNAFGQPSSAVGAGIPPNPFTGQTGNLRGAGSFPGQQNQQPNLNSQQRGNFQPAGTGPAALRDILGSNSGQPASQTTGIPRPGRGNNNAQRGRGHGLPQPVQNHQQQGVSIAGAARGGGNSSLPRRGPNTRGRGGRGNNQNVQTSGIPQQGGRNSPGGGPNSPGGGRGQLNPSARQFQPGGAGNKRPNDGEGGNAEKKFKGAGETE